MFAQIATFRAATGQESGVPGDGDELRHGPVWDGAVPAEISTYLRFLETLSADKLVELDRFVTADVQFTDPFNDVRGRAAMRRVFTHMFENLEDVTFVVTDAIGRPGLCYARWSFRANGARRHRLRLDFTGLSEIRFQANGLVTSHLDVWDPTACVYERVPVLGFVLRRLRTRLGAT